MLKNYNKFFFFKGEREKRKKKGSLKHKRERR